MTTPQTIRAEDLPAEDLVDEFRALLGRKRNPELAAFFRNQQRFLHLYALARGAAVTAPYITSLIQALDPSRTFGPRTYYHLRRELEEDGWIEMAEQMPGREENPHRVKEDRRQDFVAATIEVSLVERPVVLDKYRLFDTGLRFAGLADQAREHPAILADLRKALAEIRDEGEQQVFYPGFMLYHLVDELAALALQTTQEPVEEPKRPDNVIDGPWLRSRALSALAINLPPDHRAGLLADALDAARAIVDREDRAATLDALAPHLSPEAQAVVHAELAAQAAPGSEGTPLTTVPRAPTPLRSTRARAYFDRAIAYVAQTTAEPWRPALRRRASPFAQPSDESPEPQLAMGGMRRRRASPRAGAHFAGAQAALPGPETADLSIRLGPDPSGTLRLSISVATERLGAAELRYRFAGIADQFQLLPIGARWENDTPVAQPEDILAALSTLSLSLVGTGPQVPTALFSLTVRPGNGETQPAVSVTSSDTGLAGVRIECLIGGAGGSESILAVDGDHWQAEIELLPTEQPGPPEFALWILPEGERS